MFQPNNIVCLSGETVRIECDFYNFAGALTNPSVCKFRIYNTAHQPLEEFVLGEANRYETGKYYFDYTTKPEAANSLIFEFYGEINTNISLERGTIKTKFVR